MIAFSIFRGSFIVTTTLFISLFSWAGQTLHLTQGRKLEPRTMLNGIWIIESASQKPSGTKSVAYLPPGVHVQLNVLGPTRRAIEEGLKDELGGELTVLPPFPEDICSTSIGAWICAGDNAPVPAQPVKLDVFFTFESWSRKDAEENKFSFFARRGAQVGAQFVNIILPSQDQRPQIEWQLWMRAPDSLVGNYLLGDPEKKSRHQIDQNWRRTKVELHHHQ